MLTIGQDNISLPIEIDTHDEIQTLTFATNGGYLVSGGDKVRVWQVGDRKQMASMEAWRVRCLAVSKNGRWISAATYGGNVLVWDAETYEKVFKDWDGRRIVIAVDFSPDSTRLITSRANTIIVWNLALRSQEQILSHEFSAVQAAKYSPQGHRIATATRESVRVWNSNDGDLLVHIPVTVTPDYNNGLLWFNDHIFVLSDSAIKEFDSSTGSLVSEWAVHPSGRFSCIALPQHGEFIAYSEKGTVTFWDTVTHTQLGLIQHSRDVLSIAISPDDQFIAIGGPDGKIIIKKLADVLLLYRSTVSIAYSILESFFLASDLVSHGHLHRLLRYH